MHIICFTVPYPPDYGGVIDLFWKLPALQKAGVLIHLHCFDYGRGVQNELNKYCTAVHYYKRKTGLAGIHFSKPYIVASRKNDSLLNCLLQDNYPILMEGIHSTFLLNDVRFKHRKKIVRLHNVEYNYYKHLSQTATSFFKKIYCLTESFLLKKYEQKIINKASLFLTVTTKDKNTYEQDFGCTNVHYLPLFIPNNWMINIDESQGNYCLYQADLSVPANENAAIWLLQNVFYNLEIPFVIAGKNPSEKLKNIIAKSKNVVLQPNPSEKEMNNLIKEAQINILPSFSNTGIKLKLLHALFIGKFCLVNNATIEGTGLEDLCHIANTSKEMQEKIVLLFQQTISKSDIEKRQIKLQSVYNNADNAKQLIQYIFS